MENISQTEDVIQISSFLQLTAKKIKNKIIVKKVLKWANILLRD